MTVSPSVPESHERSLTALAGEAMSSAERGMLSRLPDDGVLRERLEIDQNIVDEVGRAYGVQEGDSGALRASSEILDRRDHHRYELIAPRQYPD